MVYVFTYFLLLVIQFGIKEWDNMYTVELRSDYVTSVFAALILTEIK